jgi:hypothetical protein
MLLSAGVEKWRFRLQLAMRIKAVMIAHPTEHTLASLVGRSIHNKNPQLWEVVVDVTGLEAVHLSGKVSSYHLRQVAVSICAVSARRSLRKRRHPCGIQRDTTKGPRSLLERQGAKGKVTARGS